MITQSLINANLKILNSRSIVDRFDELVELVRLGRADADDRDELEVIRDFNEQGLNAAPDWDDGTDVVREDHFVEYIADMLEETGQIPTNLPYYVVINWQACADALRDGWYPIQLGTSRYLVRCT